MDINALELERAFTKYVLQKPFITYILYMTNTPHEEKTIFFFKSIAIQYNVEMSCSS